MRRVATILLCCTACGARTDLLPGSRDDGALPPDLDPQVAPVACPISEPGQLAWSRIVDSPFPQTSRATLGSDRSGNLFLQLKDVSNSEGVPLENDRKLELLRLDAQGRRAWTAPVGTEPVSYEWGVLAVDATGNPVVVSPGAADGASRPVLIRLDEVGRRTSALSMTKNASGRWAPVSIGPDASGGVVVLGLAENEVDLGGGELKTSEREFFVAKLDESGEHVWSHAFGGPVRQVDMDVALNGTITIAGSLIGTVVFGDMTFESESEAPFVAALAADGSSLFSKLFASEGSVTMHDVARDPAGNSYLTLTFSGSLDLGSQTLRAPQERSSALLKLGPAGEVSWSKVLGFVDWASLDARKLDELLIAGAFRGTIDFGNGGSTGEGPGVFAANLGRDGSPRWLRDMPGASDNSHFIIDVAWGPCENVVIAGCLFGDRFDTGVETLQAPLDEYGRSRNMPFVVMFGN